MDFRPATFRPAAGRVLTVAVWLLALGMLGTIAFETGAEGLLRYAWPALFVAAAAWATLWAPLLRIEEHAITVRNVLRTHAVPWAAVQRFDTKWALTLFTESGAITVWAAPAPSRHAAASASAGDVRLVSGTALPRGEALRPGDVPTTASGGAAFLVRRHWNQLRDDGALDVAAEARRVRTTWNVGTIAVLGVLLAASVLGLTV